MPSMPRPCRHLERRARAARLSRARRHACRARLDRRRAARAAPVARRRVGSRSAADQRSPDSRLRPLAGVLDVPPIAAPLRRLCEWTADYYLAPLASVLRMVLPSSAALEGPRQLIEYRPTGRRPRSPDAAARKGARRARRPAGHDPRARRPRRGQRRACCAGWSMPARSKRSRSTPTGPLACPDPDFAPPDLNDDQREAAGQPRRGDRQGLRPRPARRRYRLGQDRSLFRGDRRVPPPGQAGARPAPRNRADRAVPQALRGAVRLRAGRVAFGPALVRSAAAPGAGSPAAKRRSRSAPARRLFLPYAKLGLIVVDEAHEPSFKQEDGVQYHARDTAVMRGKFEDIPVILSIGDAGDREPAHGRAWPLSRSRRCPQRFAGAIAARHPRDRPDPGPAAARPLARAAAGRRARSQSRARRAVACCSSTAAASRR